MTAPDTIPALAVQGRTAFSRSGVLTIGAKTRSGDPLLDEVVAKPARHAVADAQRVIEAAQRRAAERLRALRPGGTAT